MNHNHRIKAIFFDLDGTLRHSVPEGAQVFDEYLISLGYPLIEEARHRAIRWEYLYWANSPDLRDDLLAHSADTENFWIEYTRRRLVAVGLSPASAKELAPQVSAHMGEMYKPQSIVPDDVRRLLPALKEAGYILAVISNREKPFHDLLASHQLSEFFHFSLAAGEVDIYKPDPGVFHHALNRANTTAPETVYVGDNYFADVVGSRRAGLHPVLYDPNGIFPEADCPTIQSFDELHEVIESL
ncbi:MAG: HAD family hydrolase [Chloroflexi bacterium]|nr:HAD family hydrolase [Chloroflexota bacterium]